MFSPWRQGHRAGRDPNPKPLTPHPGYLGASTGCALVVVLVPGFLIQLAPQGLGIPVVEGSLEAVVELQPTALQPQLLAQLHEAAQHLPALPSTQEPLKDGMGRVARLVGRHTHLVSPRSLAEGQQRSAGRGPSCIPTPKHSRYQTWCLSASFPSCRCCWAVMALSKLAHFVAAAGGAVPRCCTQRATVSPCHGGVRGGDGEGCGSSKRLPPYSEYLQQPRAERVVLEQRYRFLPLQPWPHYGGMGGSSWL